MSWQATAYVDTIESGLTRSEKLLMFIMADHHNPEDGWAWPSISRLAAKAMLTHQHVYRLIKSLEEKGLIEVEHNGGRSTNRYRFPGMTPNIMIPPNVGVRGALTSPLHQSLSEPNQIDKRSAASRAELWEGICEELGVKSGVYYPDGYWQKLGKVPEPSPALRHLIKQLLVFQPHLTLAPGSISRLEPIAAAVNDLELTQPMHLQELDLSPGCLQKLADTGETWVNRVKNHYGRWYYEDDVDVVLRQEDELHSWIAERDRQAKVG